MPRSTMPKIMTLEDMDLSRRTLQAANAIKRNGVTLGAAEYRAIRKMLATYSVRDVVRSYLVPAI